MPTSLELYIEIVGRGTVCEGARLEVELVARASRMLPVPSGSRRASAASRCGGGGGEVVAGDEFLVESILTIGAGSNEPRHETPEAEPCIAAT